MFLKTSIFTMHIRPIHLQTFSCPRNIMLIMQQYALHMLPNLAIGFRIQYDLEKTWIFKTVC